MAVTVLFFAFAADRMNARERQFELEAGATVRDLYRRHLASALAAPLDQWMFSVNQMWAGPETVLSDGDEVAVIPPVSGG